MLRRTETYREVQRARPDGTPVGINLAWGGAAVVGAALLAALIPASQAGWRLAVLATTVGGFAAVTADGLALAGVAVLAALVADGFLENRLGELSWHGDRDRWLIAALTVAGSIGLVAGRLHRRVVDPTPPPVEVELSALLAAARVLAGKETRDA